MSSPTNPILSLEDNPRLPIIGGEPVILLEHLLFDLGAKPAIFNPQEGGAKIQFGLNLPAGIISQDTVEIVIYDEMDTVVWTSSDVLSNGEHYFVWDGLDTQTSDPVANGLYRYEVSLPNQGNVTISGVVGISQPGVMACFFNTTAPQPPYYYPPPPDEAFIDYRGSEIYPDISFYWESDPPIPELDDNDNWIARYVGYLQVEDAGMYQFRMGDTDDVARLFVDGALIQMPDWITNEQGPFDLDSPEVYLSKGLHTVIIEHAQITESASLTLLWRLNNSAWWTVDTLWQPGGDLAAMCEAAHTPFRNGDNECYRVSLYLRETTITADPMDALFKVVFKWFDGNGTPIASTDIMVLHSDGIDSTWVFHSDAVQSSAGTESGKLFLTIDDPPEPFTMTPEGFGYALLVDDIKITACP